MNVITKYPAMAPPSVPSVSPARQSPHPWNHLSQVTPAKNTEAICTALSKMTRVHQPEIAFNGRAGTANSTTNIAMATAMTMPTIAMILSDPS